MALETLFAQRTREAPSAPMREASLTPTLLPVCCVCSLIRDETGSSPDRERWVTPLTYQQTHGVNPVDFPLTHTYWLDMFHEGPGNDQAVLPGKSERRHMTLLAGSQDIDALAQILADAPSRAPDRERGPRHQASAPPGESCLRGGGLLVSSYTAPLDRDVTSKPVTLWRCVNCGDGVDGDLLANRWKSPGPLRQRARPPSRAGLNAPDGRVDWEQAWAQ